MSEQTVVTIEINNQQVQMLDRLIAEGGLGDDYGEVLRSGFLRFCADHPELAAEAAREGAGA
jgi:predicted O-methyltransferase YrrM